MVTKERTSMSLDPEVIRRVRELSERSGFTVSALANLALARITAEPAIFVPLDSTFGSKGLPSMSRRRSA